MSRWLIRETGEDVAELGGFSVVYADCPWRYRVEGGRGAADKHYETMSFAELCLLPVEKLAAPNAMIFMWAVWPMLFEAAALIKAWGFEYKSLAFIWVKSNKVADTPFVGLGRYTRANSEPCLLGIRGKPVRASAAVQQVICDENVLVSPVGAHSQKPEEAKTRVFELAGDLPAIELFARKHDPRFESFGNEIISSVSLVHGN